MMKNEISFSERQITLIELLDILKKELQSTGVNSYKTEAELILSNILGCRRFELYLKPDIDIASEQLERAKNILRKRCTHYPLQYIFGNVEFYDCKFIVDESVLIPRPETELLVDIILSENEAEHLKVLDIGTGSGAIAIALKKNRPSWQVTATDISKAALQIAAKNAKTNKCKLKLVKSDVWDNIEGKYDLIISNPPYLSEDEYLHLEQELYFEPAFALKAPDNGLYFYHRILERCREFLDPGGTVFLEIGDNQVELIRSITAKHSLKNFRSYSDFNNFIRFIRLQEY